MYYSYKTKRRGGKNKANNDPWYAFLENSTSSDKKGGNKLNNKQTYTADGVLHASAKEANRWAELTLLQKAGKISELDRQVKYELIPAQYEEIETGEFYKKGPQKGEPKKKRVCVEQSCVYIADFVYKDNDTGEVIVEDTKGYKDPSSASYAKFVIKRKLMLYLKGIKIKEI